MSSLSFKDTLQKLWNEWEVRVMVMLSLSFQFILIIFGGQRKRTASAWVGALVWIAYLAADWVATILLGIISRGQTSSCNKSAELFAATSIAAFWAPFLILHLGGPDTITAYSLQDNELWLRHLLGLIVQVGVAFYVLLHSWRVNNTFTFLAILVFVPGILKYGERTWTLRSASSDHFRDSLLPAAEPGPDYARFMDEYARREAEGLEIRYGGVIEPLAHIRLTDEATTQEAKLLTEAYFLFKIFRRLYADLILSFQELDYSLTVLRNKSSEEVFKLIEIELGIMYDVLYTKTSIAYSRAGLFLRLLSSFSLGSALVAFSVAVDKRTFSGIDVSVTYLLLAGAIFIETYTSFMLVFSERTLLHLSKHNAGIGHIIYRLVSSCPSASIKSKRWSGSIAQYNLIGFCVKDKPGRLEGIQKFFRVHERFEKSWYKTYEEVTPELKELIFLHINQKKDSFLNSGSCKSLLQRRGDYVLERKSTSCLGKFCWSITEVEFDQSILLWHIATDLCYYSDIHGCQDDTPSSKSKISKSLSDYMLYLLVIRPLMLPKGIGEIRFRDTCAEAIRFVQQRRESISRRRSEACKLLLQVKTTILPNEVKGDRSKSELFNGCRLAKSLQALETEDQWGKEEKWDMIAQVWIEMLSYAASQCQWSLHIQQLPQGGELLTHVSLLIANLGLSEQFQISQGNARLEFY
ncbi:hypothetical protein NMG60_11015258 [Bertholletia excelsa]